MPTPETATDPFDPEELRRIVADVFDVDVCDVTDTARFAADLGGDSLIGLELVVTLEKRYAVRIDEAEFAAVTDLASARDLIASKLGGRR